MEQQLEIWLENGYLKIKRHSACPRPEDYQVNPLAAFQRAKKNPLPFRIVKEEQNTLFLLRALTSEEITILEKQAYEMRLNCWNQRQEKLRMIQEMFGDALSELDEQSESPESRPIDATEPLYLCVFSNQDTLFCIWGYLRTIYHSLVSLSISVKKLSLNKKELSFCLYTAAANPYGLNVEPYCRLAVHKLESTPQKLAVEVKTPSAKKLRKKKYQAAFVFQTGDIADCSAGNDSPVKMEGNPCQLLLTVNGETVIYNIYKKAPFNRKKQFGFKHSRREYFIPMVMTYYKPYAIHIRRSDKGSLVLIKRLMEPIESTFYFKLMESKSVSWLLFQAGRICSHIPGRKKIALMYEKNAAKADEGVFELFQLCLSSKKTNSYFVLERNCPAYDRLGGSRNVVVKFSPKYYWLLFNANYFISSEATAHLNILNSNNPYIRWTTMRHPFVFLQHGIIFMKPLGRRSTYTCGRAGQANYIVVSSEKERQVVSNMMRLPPEKVWNTGLMMFDYIPYHHLNQASKDKVTIMLTWKAYEEHLPDFEASTYYQYTMKAFQLLQKYIDRSRINIVAHPRAYDLLMSTSIHDLVWQKPISEALAESKLLITDYSSVCWNVMFHGGGVVFLQPDLEEYERYMGKLVPKPHEYTGRRVLDFDSLDRVLANGIQNGSINLSYFRTPADEAMYATINEHHDGKNTERVYQKLVEIGFM